jgi:hypothetical protein
MNDLERDSLRARLREGDPYQGEPMPAPDAVRIKARMRERATSQRGRPYWMLAAAAAGMAVVGALGVWVGPPPSTTEEPLPLSPQVSAPRGGDAVADVSTDPVVVPESPPAREPGRPGLAATQPAPASPVAVEPRRVATAPPQVASTDHVAQATITVAAIDPPRAKTRHIQFTAPRGTRIVWTLDPYFEPSTTRTDEPPARHQQGANGKW